MNRVHRFIFAITCLMIINQCTPQISGGSSDHENAKIAGIVKDSYGYPAEEVSIELLPADYNPLKDDKQLLKETISDSNGCFVVEKLKAGSYCISGEDRNNQSFLRWFTVTEEQFLILDSLSLNFPGSIRILADSIGLKPGDVAYLRGLTKYCTINSNREAFITDIPSGVVYLRGYALEKKQEIVLKPAFDSLIILPCLTFISSVSPPPFFVNNKDLTLTHTGITDSTYMFSCIDPNQKIPSGYSFRYSWGDGTTSELTNNPLQIYTWHNPGFYQIQAQIRYNGTYYAWSVPLSITIDPK